MNEMIVSTLTPDERIKLFVSLVKYMLGKGEVEASTLRTNIKLIEEGK